MALELGLSSVAHLAHLPVEASGLVAAAQHLQNVGDPVLLPRCRSNHASWCHHSAIAATHPLACPGLADSGQSAP